MKLCKMCRAEMKRMFSISNVLITLGLSLLIIVMAVTTYAREYGLTNEYFYHLYKELFCGGYFCELLFISIGYFVTTNVCMDIIGKGYYMFMARTNIHSYILSKYIIGVVYSFVMTVVILNIFVFWGTHAMSAVNSSYYSGGADVYEDLLRNNVLGYFELQILFVSLVTSLFVAVGMVLSVLISNLYVAALSPFLTYITVTKLQLIFRMPECTQFEGIIAGFIRTSSTVKGSVCYILMFYISCLLLVGYVYYSVMKRRCLGERN